MNPQPLPNRLRNLKTSRLMIRTKERTDSFHPFLNFIFEDNVCFSYFLPVDQNARSDRVTDSTTHRIKTKIKIGLHRHATPFSSTSSEAAF